MRQKADFSTLVLLLREDHSVEILSALHLVSPEDFAEMPDTLAVSSEGSL